jgi:two-component system chemotaxis response regulator CheB
MKKGRTYDAVVIGSSTGGLNALRTILVNLKNDFSIPIIVVQHLSPDSENLLVRILDEQSPLRVREAEEKESPEAGCMYIAPPNYHLLIESDKTFTLSIDERVNFSRPSVDVLFETAAEAYRSKLIGIILTGANNDGSNGMKRIKELGGFTIVQDPASAEAPAMPQAALEKTPIDLVLSLDHIAQFLNGL